MVMFFRAGKVVAAVLALLLAGAAATAAEPRADASKPWLGVYLADEVDGGIRIVAVVPGGPASVAGLRSGDLMIEADNVQLADQEALERVLTNRGSEAVLSVAVLRDGQAHTFEVRPTERSTAWPLAVAVPEPPAILAQPPLSVPGGQPGAKTVEITDELRQHYGAPAGRGVLVVRVDEAGACREAGIEVGDVLVEVGEQPVKTPLELEIAFARRDRNEPLEIGIVRDRKPVVKTIPAAVAIAPTAPRVPRATRESHVRNLERSIEMLERRIEELRRQLAEVKNEAPVPHREKPANPDR